MKDIMVKQGRKIAPTDIQLIQQLLADNPSWGRSRLSKELCELWQWYNLRGQMKDMACRSLLLKLEQAGCIVLPASKEKRLKASKSYSRLFMNAKR